MNSTALYVLMTALDNGLVTGLGSEDFTIREACTNTLTARGWQAQVALKAGTHSHDTEISRTSQLILNLALEEQVDSLRDSNGLLPEIDAAWFDVQQECYRPGKFSDRYDHMVPYLESVGRDGPPWHNYRSATHLWLRAELESGTDISDLHSLVLEMRFRDAVFLSQHRYGTMDHDNCPQP